MDEAIALIAAAQQPDGYLSTMPLASQKPRFQNAQDHELYNMGHLLTAGVIHHRMTGKDNLLNVARHAGDFLCANVGVTVKPYMAHNPSAIMGLVELSRLTGESKYLACAQLIVDKRGTEPKRQSLWAMQPGIDGTDIIQDRVPVRTSHGGGRSQRVLHLPLHRRGGPVRRERRCETVHRARSALGGSDHPQDVHQWRRERASDRAFAQRTRGRGCRSALRIAQRHCYNETCGQIGVFMWGYRMLVNQPESRFADIMEREMFNGILPCLGLDGRSWFYRAVLRRYDENYKPPAGRTWRNAAGPVGQSICCPSNLLRTMAQLAPISTAATTAACGCITTVGQGHLPLRGNGDVWPGTSHRLSLERRGEARHPPGSSRTGGSAPARARLGRRARVP